MTNARGVLIDPRYMLSCGRSRNRAFRRDVAERTLTEHLVLNKFHRIFDRRWCAATGLMQSPPRSAKLISISSTNFTGTSRLELRHERGCALTGTLPARDTGSGAVRSTPQLSFGGAAVGRCLLNSEGKFAVRALGTAFRHAQYKPPSSRPSSVSFPPTIFSVISFNRFHVCGPCIP
jgi:hypothetical protein